jgi:SpoVK/Ycf46/Vps4 family AAA+-type ATPase
MDQDIDLLEISQLPQWLQTRLVADRGTTTPARQADFCVIAGKNGDEKFKTVQRVAAQFQQPLVRVNLSTVISSNLSETEKNLQRLLGELAATGAILYIDEADALFGKRTDVRDAHDRYANLDLGRLAERLGMAPGLKIYAVSAKDNIDPAFMRRLRAITPFPPN